MSEAARKVIAEMLPDATVTVADGVIYVHVPAETPMIDLAETLKKRQQRIATITPSCYYPCEPVRSKAKPVVSGQPRIGRNSPCTCGSGKKFKACCLAKTNSPNGVTPE